MKILTGKGVCSGVAVGILRYYKENETNIKRVHIEDTEKEIEKLEDAEQKALKQLDGLYSRLLRADKTAVQLILKTEAERIHTLIPGFAILQHVFTRFDADEIIISSYGVREGYLCQKLLKSNTFIPKAEN